MEKKLPNQKAPRYLLMSFLALVIFSILVFSILSSFMNRKSEEAVYKVGNLYMQGLGEQLSKHFEGIIELRFDQLEGLKEVIPEEITEVDALYAELAYRARVRGFKHLALCSATGDFQTIDGEAIEPRDPQLFLETLTGGKKSVMTGTDAQGATVVLFGVAGKYPMADGGVSTGLVTALPIAAIEDILLQESEESLLHCHLIRMDGSFVIHSAHGEANDFFNDVRDRYSTIDRAIVDEHLLELQQAMETRNVYASSMVSEAYREQVYEIPMPYSDWYLIMVMPYGELDKALTELSDQRSTATLVACGSILVLLILIFILYYMQTRRQLAALELARSEAVEATKAKSEFLSNMSHDIRTPMNAIVGMTAVAMTHGEDTDYVQNCLKKIALSSKHLLGLINDVLDMSKIESGKMTLSADQASLREIIEGIVGIVQPQVKAKRQSFDVRIDNIIAEKVVCDSVRLNQVLLNLLSNAVKYTPEGGEIELSISEEASPAGDDFIRVHAHVKDNGIGMTEEFLNRIYDSYSRADNERVHKIEGAGLGMAITKHIVDAMGGAIDVTSEVGKGTEFHVVLDLEKATTTEVDMILPAWNMLVVDDDETLCQTAMSTLQSIGVKAEWTLSGERAVQMVTHRHQIGDDYQIILLDWKLPGMDGIQTAREIRRQLGEDVPILLISAYDWSDFSDEAKEAGINGFISKPLFRSTLFYGLKQYMMEDHEAAQHEEKDIDFTGKRVLLAEDNELNWEIAYELLSELKLELEWAENGQLCLEKFQSSEPGAYDAILMDLRMPVMNGYEATQAIRALDRPDAKTIPIIAMTADAFAEDIQRCMDCGMNAHTAKPINLAEMARLLRKYIAE